MWVEIMLQPIHPLFLTAQNYKIARRFNNIFELERDKFQL